LKSSSDQFLNPNLSSSFSIKSIWPYIIFLFAVIIYSYFFLADGFNATDEGYLQSLGQRIVDGEQPYLDFYFMRSPLSIYIQAALIKIFGDNYTILAGRIYWTIQICLMVLLVSLIYRRFVNRLELLLMLLASYVLCSVLIAFPWYNYDAAFFAAVSAVFIFRRQYFLAGIAAFLSAMSKQNYVFMLPMFLVLVALLRWRIKAISLLKLKDTAFLLAGFAVPGLLYSTYLLYLGGFSAFVNQLFFLPKEISDVSLTHTLFQNNHIAIVKALPVIILTILLFYFKRQRLLLSIITVIAVAVSFYSIFIDENYFIFSVIYLCYTVIILIVIELIRKRKLLEDPTIKKLAPLIILGFIIQYLAGFNYAGLIWGYPGLATILPVAYLLFKNISPSMNKKTIAMSLLVVLLGTGTYYKYTWMYRDAKRWELNAEFTTPKLKGIKSTTRNVRQIDSMTTEVNRLTEKDDYVFIFPDFAAFYYLTDRRNPTPVAWYYRMEFGKHMIQEAIDALEKHQPEFIFVQTYAERDYMRRGIKYHYDRHPLYTPIMVYITEKYDIPKPLGDIYVLERKP